MNVTPPSLSDRDPLAPCWVHDMAVTRTHLVVVEAPVFINMQSLVLGEPRPYVFMDWRPEVCGKEAGAVGLWTAHERGGAAPHKAW